MSDSPYQPQPLTAAQTDAMDKIKHLIGEHFDAGVVVILRNHENPDDASTGSFDILLAGHGGPIVGIGLIQTAQMQLMRSLMFRNEA